jgi:hypothetical protein
MPGPVALVVGRVLTWLLELDMVFFRGIRTGPFFGLARVVPRAVPPARAGQGAEPA